MTIDCPHCGGRTALVSNLPGIASAPARDSSEKPNSKLPLVAGSVLLALILAATGVARYRAGKQSSTFLSPTNAVTQARTNSETSTVPSRTPEEGESLNAGPVTLQRTEGSGLVYAIGTANNNSDRQRFGVRIELDLLDEHDNKIGTASDYIAVLEPHKDWQFRALLSQPKAAKAKIAKIEEQK
jgi:hypothetical protein